MTEHNVTAVEPSLEHPLHGLQVRSVKNGRFNLPHAFRIPGEDRYVVCPGPSAIPMLQPYSIWLHKFKNVGRDKSPAERREAKRKLSMVSQVVDPDQQGRIAVSESYLESAGITTKIAIVGMGNYMELWNPDVLERSTADGDEEIDADVLDEFFD